MAHRAAPISVSVALGHTSANAVRATAGGWSTGSSILLCRASNEKAEGTTLEIFGMTGRGWNPRLTGCKADALPLLHHTDMYDKGV